MEWVWKLETYPINMKGKYNWMICFSESSWYAAIKDMYPTGWLVPYPLGNQLESQYAAGYLKYAHISQTYDLSICFINRHQSSWQPSYLWKYPSIETSNPIIINKHLLESLIQQQIYFDIQPKRDATEFKTLVLKYKRSLTTTEGDENHNETKKMNLLYWFHWKEYNHLHIKHRT